MALSNKHRQERYRAGLKVRAEIFERIVEGWLERRDGLMQQLDLLERGLMRTGSNRQDTTADSIERIKRYLTELDQLIGRYEDIEPPPFHWRIEPAQAAPNHFTFVQVPPYGEVGLLYPTRGAVERELRDRGLVPHHADPDIWCKPAGELT
jgi:hypothetical protein